MADLGDVLAAIVSAVGQARRQADEQTAALAEYYRSEPLLEGMSIPRVRLPQVTVDLPVVVAGQTSPAPGKPASVSVVARMLTDRLQVLFRTSGARLPSGSVSTYQGLFKTALEGVRIDPRTAGEAYARATQQATTEFARKFPDAVDDRLLAVLDRELASIARAKAYTTPPTPGSVDVEVVTGKVRDTSDPSLVTRLHLSMHEDAMEWAIYENEDGTQGRRLLPE